MQWLEQSGLAVTVWPVGDGASLPEALAHRPVRTSLRASLDLARLRRRLGAALEPGDVIVSHWLPVGLALADRAPTLAWAHGGDVALLEALPRGRVLARRLDATARALAFVSEDLRDRFTALIGRTPRAPQWLLPMGVAPAKPDPTFVKALRERAGARPIVATVGRLVPIKGLDVLARALPPEVVWFAAGTGPEAEPLARICPDFHGLGALTPGQRDALLSVASVFVQPSRAVGHRREGTPVAVLEAMQSGVPVVASETGGLGMLARSAGALVVPPEDASALRGALDALLGDAPRRAALAHHHRQAAARFAWSLVGPDHARAVMRLLSTTLARPASPSAPRGGPP